MTTFPRYTSTHSMRDNLQRQQGKKQVLHLHTSCCLKCTLESSLSRLKKTPASLNSMFTHVLNHISMHGCNNVQELL